MAPQRNIYTINDAIARDNQIRQENGRRATAESIQRSLEASQKSLLRQQDQIFRSSISALPRPSTTTDYFPTTDSLPNSKPDRRGKGLFERVLEFVGELVLKGATILIVLFGIGVTLSFYLVPSIQATFPTVSPLGYFALAVAAGIGAGFAAGLMMVWLLQNIFWVAAVLALVLGIHFFA
jgi:hypothetical protein